MIEVIAFIAVCYFLPVPCLVVGGIIGGILALSWVCERLAAAWRGLLMRAARIGG